MGREAATQGHFEDDIVTAASKKMPIYNQSRVAIGMVLKYLRIYVTTLVIP
jgi:hypothetical protein